MLNSCIHEVLADAYVAGDADLTVGPAFLARASEWTVYLTFGAGVTAGVFAVETASHEEYGGTWANLGTITWAAASRVHTLSVTGVYLAVRIRPTTPIADGSARIELIGRAR